MLLKYSKAIRFCCAFFALSTLLMILSGGCARAPVSTGVSLPTPLLSPAPRPPTTERERRTADYVVLTATSSDTYESLARHYLGDEKLFYIISEYNELRVYAVCSVSGTTA